MGQNKLPHHMNYILVVAWDAFKVSDIKIIEYRFVKTKPPTLRPTKLTTNTQVCAVSVQVSYESKAEKINEISCRTVAHIEVQETRTKYPMVFLL